ncbi:MAG: ribulose 1,5-bisphosphate carboxylase [Alphaproteobacteria bacterium]|nr:ribulose 1,5-bisphosphate carboxylase [Alphaproteobacteria bacterium]
MVDGTLFARDEIVARYVIRAADHTIEARAQALALEQSVELPMAAVENARLRDEIVGRVLAIEPERPGVFDVRIGLAVSTTGFEAGQLLNMLFGNSSIHADITLADVEFPTSLCASFGGPRAGIAGLRQLANASNRALTCAALKPQGLSAEALATLAEELALGGVDFIKDDHGLADQSYSPFARRAALCAQAVARANTSTGRATRYFPNISGSLDVLRAQTRLAQDEGLAGVLVAPLIVGVASLQTLVREFPRMVFMAHPAMAGAARIAPPFLLGRLFRLLGADATIFPNHGGRFGYSPKTCLKLAKAARAPWDGIRPTLPVAAGGMTPARVPEMLDFYGADIMLLIGGGLLLERARLTQATRAFVQAATREIVT